MHKLPLFALTANCPEPGADSIVGIDPVEVAPRLPRALDERFAIKPDTTLVTALHDEDASRSHQAEWNGGLAHEALCHPNEVGILGRVNHREPRLLVVDGFSPCTLYTISPLCCQNIYKHICPLWMTPSTKK